MSKSSGNLMAGGYEDGDIWDDTELIRSYDKSVKNWRRSHPNQDRNDSEETPGPGPWQEVTSSNDVDKQLAVPIAALPLSNDQIPVTPAILEVGSWIVGSPCRALYSADGLEYEAKIVGIEGACCTVRFIGYGNEEQVNLTDLRTTHGKKSRDKQRRSAHIYHQSMNNGTLDIDCVSNVSLTSSMYNNYSESICRERDLEETLNVVLTTPLQSSTPRSVGSRPQNKLKIAALGHVGKPKFVDQQSEPVDTMDSAIPSAAEATIDSSSQLDSDADEEPQEAAATVTNGDWENFNNTMPQFKFPVPPMPLSLSNNDGNYDFGRGELPALLMSWYMAGYQSGYFDAKRGMSASPKDSNRSKSSKRAN